MSRRRDVLQSAMNRQSLEKSITRVWPSTTLRLQSFDLQSRTHKTGHKISRQSATNPLLKPCFWRSHFLFNLQVVRKQRIKPQALRYL